MMPHARGRQKGPVARPPLDPVRKSVRGLHPNRFARPSHVPAPNLAELEETTRIYASKALANSTQRSYARGLQLWDQFCAFYRLDSVPTPRSLALFASWLTQRGIKSIRQPFSALRSRYRGIPDWDKIRSDPLVHDVLRGIRRVHPHTPKRAPALRLQHLMQVVANEISTRASYENLLRAFIACAAFCGLMRLGEAVMPKDARDFILKDYAQRDTFVLEADTMRFFLPKTKTKQFGEGGWVVVHRNLVPAGVPLFALAHAFIRARDAWLGPAGLLFGKKEGGRLLSRDNVVNMLKAIDPELTGHSFRAGGATYLASIGVREEDIKRMGRWTSDAWQIYVREHPTIIAELQRRYQHQS